MKSSGSKSAQTRRAGRHPHQAKPSETELSAGRRRLFRIAALLLPVLALCLLEGTLRLAGYGYPTTFFIQKRIQEEAFFVQNDDFALRFFPPEIARNPGPIRMRAHKPPDTFRIFIFGESAAMGDPEPAYGAGRYMETLLRERFPVARFEVINTAFTAINSHVILPIARECAKRDGDLWIIYMGNNEMVGPFGAATVFGAKAPPLLFVRISVAIQKLRVGQLLMAAVRKIGSRPASTVSWGGMQMFIQNQIAPDDPGKHAVYHHFQGNLEGILDAGHASGARVLLSTVAVNLKDCPPFASVTDSNLTTAQRAQIDRLLAEANRAQSQSDFTNAANLFGEASKLDPSFAEYQFRLAQCELQSGRFAEARMHFQSACDADALPFRADTRINSSIRDAAKKYTGTNLLLMEADAAIETNGMANIPGEESFFEHVHLNFEGNYRLGLAWARQAEQSLPAAFRARDAGNWATQQDCDRRLGLTDWNRSFVLESVIRRLQQAPLSSQFNNAARLASFHQQLQTLRGRMDSAAASRVHAEFPAEIQRNPEDYSLREGFADFLEATGAFHEAELQWRQVQALIPQDFLAAYQLGRMLAKQNDLEGAASALRRAINIRPGFAEAWVETGRVQATEQNFAAALESFAHACRLRPQDPVALSYKARTLSKLNRRGEAIALYRRCIEMNPNYWEAHNALADELASADQTADAAHEYEIVTSLNPDYPMAHLNLGVMFVKLGRIDEGSRQFEETLRLEPANATAREYLNRVRNRKP